MHRAVRSSRTHTQIYTFKVHLKHFVCYIDAVAKTAFHAANKILIDIFGRCALVCTTLCVCVCLCIAIYLANIRRCFTEKVLN